jgi:hypothetical protein
MRKYFIDLEKITDFSQKFLMISSSLEVYWCADTEGLRFTCVYMFTYDKPKSSTLDMLHPFSIAVMRTIQKSPSIEWWWTWVGVGGKTDEGERGRDYKGGGRER